MRRGPTRAPGRTPAATPRLGLLLAALALAAAGRADPAEAGCTTGSEARALQQSMRRAVSCNDSWLRRGPGAACKRSPPPACAGSLAADVVSLGYGPNSPPVGAVGRAAAKQLRCQKQIGRALSGYVGRKLRYRIEGMAEARAEALARGQLAGLSDRCLVTVQQDASGVAVPAVGAQCAAALPPGGRADPRALRDCLHTLLRVWVERWGPEPRPLRPNILLLLTDDQRWDTTGGTHGVGGADVMPRTRAELAARGLELSEAFVTTPLCCPSRASILTGQYAHRTGVYRNGGVNGGADDFDDAESVAVWLQRAGYRTSFIGKYLNGYALLSGPDPEQPYVPPGWSEWRGLRTVAYFLWTLVEPGGLGGYQETKGTSDPESYLTDVLRERAKAFLSTAVSAGEPFFLQLAFSAPHVPPTPAPRHQGTFASIPPWRPPSYNEPDVSDKPTWLSSTPELTAEEQAALDELRSGQLEMLQAVDEAIGGSTGHAVIGVMEHLRALGVEDDTLVVFSSDNGFHWGEHRTRSKLKPYEEAIRVPMLVHYPRLVPLPRSDARLALNIDLAPTFAELAGAAVPIPQDGRSLVRVLDGTEAAWRSDFLTEGWFPNQTWASVRQARWKYVELPLTPGDPDTDFERELYDLAADPHEQHNLASDPQHAARIAALAARLRQLRPSWPTDSALIGPDPEEDD